MALSAANYRDLVLIGVRGLSIFTEGRQACAREAFMNARGGVRGLPLPFVYRFDRPLGLA
jgi:hypothetical protein